PSQCKDPRVDGQGTVGIARAAGIRDGKRAASIIRYDSSSGVYEQAVGRVRTGNRNRIGATRVEVGGQTGGRNSIAPIGCRRPLSAGAVDPVIKCVDGETGCASACSGIAIILAPGAADDADRAG